MNQRVRPSGTDGSDFSYRMVVDSRYTKVATKKKTLLSLIFAQAVRNLLAIPYVIVALTNKESLDLLTASSLIIGFISLIIGELGRSRSRVNLLRLYMFGSFISFLISAIGIVRSELTMEVIQNPSGWRITYDNMRVTFGLFIELSVIWTVTTLISNMTPPKRAA
ncbi:hypothetical protein ACFE04_015048 [Oxalis oulophora]